MNFQKSLSLFSLFEIATPNIIAIILYLSIVRLRITPPNTILLFLGLVNDIMTGDNLGTTSIFLMLFKYFTESLFLDKSNKKTDEDWLSFTMIFIISFGIVFFLNALMNLAMPQLSPIFFHVGITLILFPIINISIDFFSFLTRLIKS